MIIISPFGIDGNHTQTPSHILYHSSFDINGKGSNQYDNVEISETYSLKHQTSILLKINVHQQSSMPLISAPRNK